MNPTGPHMFDPRTQLNYVIWHRDATTEKFIRHLIETVKPDRWVETGSHMGWTSMWIALNYPHLPIYTVEVDPEFYEKARANLAQFPQVSITHGKSPDFLRKLLPMLQNGLTVFWLDAHWWPPVPLKEECAVVASLDKYVCLIDDFECWDPFFEGDIFFSTPPAGLPGYINDLSYVGPVMGEKYWRPTWERTGDGKGIGMFLKDVNYDPAPFMKFEDGDTFLRTRGQARFSMHPDFRKYYGKT